VSETNAYETIAAVDLGSNSFHMIVARLQDEQLQVIDRLREPVRLAAGLDERDRLDAAANARALDCLQRFGQRLREMPAGAVRVVGTNTLRRAHETSDFLDAAQQALGHPIEIISGIEEARLIYLGVSHSLVQAGKRRLVIDIGGGSTELIIGEEFQPRYLESLYMGCVQMSRAFFADGKISKPRMRDAVLAARLELQPVEVEFRRRGWDSVAGASGTIKAVREVVAANGWSDYGITPDSLRRLRKALVTAGDVNSMELKGLQEGRQPVFPGGVAVLSAVFEALEIERMQVSQGALREGLLYDLIGRIRHEDTREATVAALEQRYQIDTEHAQRVSVTALSLFDQAPRTWGLDESGRHWLEWAARLHELGVAIAHSQHHRHGAYVLQHGDLFGFSYRDQMVLAVLVRCHRRRVVTDIIESLPKGLIEPVTRLVVLMRLAVLLHRSRSPAAIAEVPTMFQEQGVKLMFPEGWLDEHPLTRGDLELEQGYLDAIGYQLRFG
jgi:exopolyphosphatase/guanosine-5'-triphosphate,3'-diphosphate pyrophosphatase